MMHHPCRLKLLRDRNKLLVFHHRGRFSVDIHIIHDATVLYKLRIAPCFALPQSYRYSDFALSRYILIPVAFETAYSLLHTLRV